MPSEQVCYCSATCQKEDWERHNKFCGKVMKIRFILSLEEGFRHDSGAFIESTLTLYRFVPFNLHILEKGRCRRLQSLGRWSSARTSTGQH